MTIRILLFERFETLDAFGPVEMLADMGKNTIVCCSLAGGWLGARLAITRGAGLIRLVMLGVLGILTVRLVIELLY